MSVERVTMHELAARVLYALAEKAQAKGEALLVYPEGHTESVTLAPYLRDLPQFERPVMGDKPLEDLFSPEVDVLQARHITREVWRKYRLERPGRGVVYYYTTGRRED